MVAEKHSINVIVISILNIEFIHLNHMEENIVLNDFCSLLFNYCIKNSNNHCLLLSLDSREHIDTR